jgi:hypothetical protein
MLLKANHWYICTGKGSSISTQILHLAEDWPVSSEDWQEISPPTITLKKKDLSHAVVGDIVKWGSRTYKVLNKDGEGAVLLDEDTNYPVTLRTETCEKADFPSYTLIS